jgi:hypothetical protein
MPKLEESGLKISQTEFRTVIIKMLQKAIKHYLKQLKNRESQKISRSCKKKESMKKFVFIVMS